MTPYLLTEEDLVILASMELNEKLVIEFPSAHPPNRLEITKVKRQVVSKCTECCCSGENGCRILFKSGKLKLEQDISLIPFADYTRPCLDISDSPVYIFRGKVL